MGTLARLWAFFTGTKEEAPVVAETPPPVSEAPKKVKKPRKPRPPKKVKVAEECPCEKPRKPKRQRKPKPVKTEAIEESQSPEEVLTESEAPVEPSNSSNTAPET